MRSSVAPSICSPQTIAEQKLPTTANAYNARDDPLHRHDSTEQQKTTNPCFTDRLAGRKPHAKPSVSPKALADISNRIRMEQEIREQVSQRASNS